MAARTSCEINLPCKRYALVLLLIEEFVNFCENNLTVDNLDALLSPAFPAGFFKQIGRTASFGTGNCATFIWHLRSRYRP